MRVQAFFLLLCCHWFLALALSQYKDLAMRKSLALLLLTAATSVFSIFALGGCTDDNKRASSAPAPDAIVLHVGYENAKGEPFDLGCQHWQELLEQRSEGKLTLKLYPSSTLGSKSEIMDRMAAGEPVATLTDGAFFYDRGIYDLGITFGPFLFNNWEEAFRLYNSTWFKEQEALVEKKAKMKIIASNWRYGARHTLSVKPVTKVEDFQGLKIRVPQNNIQIKAFEVLGATPEPMPLSEVYNALKQGRIDAVENPLAVLYNGHFHDIAKNLLLDGHIYNVTNITVGLDFWNSLSTEQQKILSETCKEAGIYQNQKQSEAEDELLKKFEAEGVTITFPDELLRIQLKAASLKFYTLEDFSNWSPNLYETVNREMHSY